MSDKDFSSDELRSRRLNWDEYRLLQFFRMLDKDLRDTLLANAGRLAADRWYPHFTPQYHEPQQQTSCSVEGMEKYKGLQCGADREPLEFACEDVCGGDDDWIFKQVADGEAARFAQVVNETQGFHDYEEGQSEYYLAAWKMEAMAAIRDRYLSAARTADEARWLPVTVPENVKEWQSFAVLIDGDAISEELDLPYPGEQFGWHFEPHEEPDVAQVRLMLLHWHRRTLSYPDGSKTPDPAEIQRVLDWLRDRLPSPDTAQAKGNKNRP